PYVGWPVAAYEVWRQLDGGPWRRLDSLSGTQLNYSRSDRQAGLIHRYRIRARQAGGGYDSWSQPVELGFAHPLMAPNVFSPNGDGIHDRWVVDNLALYPDNRLEVYDRWGRQVYAVEGYRNEWEGTGLPAGVYYFRLQVRSAQGDYVPPPLRGAVTLLR
ncbi:MAG: gliding motility-associated C-terminal domain-containing protein, partial [Bacteroidetes bacterium]